MIRFIGAAALAAAGIAGGALAQSATPVAATTELSAPALATAIANVGSPGTELEFAL